MSKLSLPNVTLCCVDTTGRLPTSLLAIQRCMEQVEFGDAILLTDPAMVEGMAMPAGLRIVPIAPITSIEGYSHFMLKGLAPFVQTSHCLVMQWDGYVLDAGHWTDEYLACDYIGAPWGPGQVPPGCEVGNGGFSLRSRKLLQALQDPALAAIHPEDACICQTHRAALEAKGIVFAPLTLARRFAVEDGEMQGDTFGFHGPQHLPRVLGPQQMVDFIAAFSPEKLLFSNLFDMLLRELTRSAARDAAFRPALDALCALIDRAVTEHKEAARSSSYSLLICKALIRYSQFSAARSLLACRIEAEGMTRTNLTLSLRLNMFQALQSLGLRKSSQALRTP